MSYPDDQYRVVYGSTEPEDQALLVRRNWYSHYYGDWMKKDKGDVYSSTVYNVTLDSLGTLHYLGRKNYELSDHLGNVLVTVTDKRTGYGNASGNYTRWHANITGINDYYPFGMTIEDRTSEYKNYRFSHTIPQMKTDEIAGKNNHHTAEFWEYSPRIARRWNLDPVDQISISNYAVFGLNPILYSDILGNSWTVGTDNNTKADVYRFSQGKE
ncbi:MAG: hypothetical protein KL787_05670 [Taibaiella sp.]|nr:hypothetical protein [Taibaiella sp.]